MIEHKNTLLTLQHIADSSYPIGSFAYSWGLEYAIQKRWINNYQSLLDWANESIEYSYLPLDARSSVKSCHLIQSENINQILNLNEELSAFKPNKNIREASAQTARSFYLITKDVYGIKNLNPLDEYIMNNKYLIQFPIVWGIACYSFNISEMNMVQSLLLSTIKQWAQVVIRILPMKQNEAHMFIANMIKYIEKLTDKLDLNPNIELQSITPGMDIACMGHEYLTSRYFRT